MKDAFKGEKCYVLSCGPTLLQNNLDKLRELGKNNIVISVKQTLDMFPELTDFHVYNCANFKEYEYSSHRPIVFEASSTPYHLGDCDIKFFIREREFTNSVAHKKNFDEWTLDKQRLLRPYGPGIMYEIAICINALCFDKRNNKFVLNNQKVKSLIKGYQSVKKIYQKEKDALNVLCRGAALRYLLTRIYDYINTPKTALIKIKDPKEYFQKLIIHNNLNSFKNYYN